MKLTPKRRKTSRKVCVLTTRHKPQDVRVYQKECLSLVEAGYEVVFLVLSHSGPSRGLWVRWPAVIRAIRKVLRAGLRIWNLYWVARPERAAVYHFHDPEILPVGLLLRWGGASVIYDSHEDFPRQERGYIQDRVPGWLAKWIEWGLEKAENIFARQMSAIVCATPAIAERFEKVNDHCFVVQNFPLKSEIQTGKNVPWSRRKQKVAYVGGISLQRGLFQMIEAMDMVPSKFRAILCLAGPFSPDSLRRETRVLPGADKVEILGILDRKEVGKLLQTARIGLVLFHPAPNHIRAQPNKLFEYMAAGIPVIGSHFPLWRKIIQGARCGFVVDPLDPSAIAKAIAYLLSHPREAQTMGRRGLEAIHNRYNWDIEKKKLLRLYKRLLG